MVRKGLGFGCLEAWAEVQAPQPPNARDSPSLAHNYPAPYRIPQYLGRSLSRDPTRDARKARSLRLAKGKKTGLPVSTYFSAVKQLRQQQSLGVHSSGGCRGARFYWGLKLILAI